MKAILSPDEGDTSSGGKKDGRAIESIAIHI